MTLKQFIKENRIEIDTVINLHRRLNDNDREDWIMNNETLYNWARKYVKDL